jgi:hypothetical protein
MSDVRLQIPDDLVNSIQEKTGSNIKATDIAKDAITLYNWAVEERAKGRLILSTNADGDDMVRLAMPSIESANPLKK